MFTKNSLSLRLSSHYSFSGWKYGMDCDPSRSLTDEKWMLRCAADINKGPNTDQLINKGPNTDRTINKGPIPKLINDHDAWASIFQDTMIPWSKIQTIFIFKSDFKCAPTSMIVPGSRRFITFIAVIRVRSRTNNMWSGETDCVERESQGEMWSDYWKMETRGSYSLVLSHSPYAHITLTFSHWVHSLWYFR